MRPESKGAYRTDQTLAVMSNNPRHIMVRRITVLLLAVFSTSALAMTHTEELRRSEREKGAAQEKARMEEEQRQLKLVEECDRTARQKYTDRKQRDRYYEDCVTKALGTTK